MNLTQTAMKTANPDEVRYCCPRCGDTGFHLYYNLKKNLFHCFKCGARGHEAPDRDYSEDALLEMREVLTSRKSAALATKVSILPRSEPVRPDSPAMRYMKYRGIPESKVQDMGCLTSRVEGFDWRIIIPAYNEAGEPSYYQARAITRGVKPKYLNPIASKNDALFYNMGRIPTPQPHLVLVEGIFKALNLWRIGVPSVAIFGKEITKPQINRVKKLTNRITIILDPDAYSFSLRLADTLKLCSPAMEVDAIHPPRPPDEMSTDSLRKLLKGRFDV